MGLCEIALKEVEAEAATLRKTRTLERQYKSLGADKSTHFQSFTGNRILSDKGVEAIIAVISESAKANVSC